MIVNEENKVEQRPITVGPAVDGWVVIEDGLQLDDAVVIDGLQKARPGVDVNPIKETLEVPESRFIGDSNMRWQAGAPDEEQQD